VRVLAVGVWVGGQGDAAGWRAARCSWLWVVQVVQGPLHGDGHAPLDRPPFRACVAVRRGRERVVQLAEVAGVTILAHQLHASAQSPLGSGGAE